jgi:hypothetical protein
MRSVEGASHLYNSRKKGLKGRAADRYTFGALNNMNAMHGNKETAHGAAMQRKHDKMVSVERLRA